jgi:hypothetical protein
LDDLISADRFSDFDAKASGLWLTLATDPVENWSEGKEGVTPDLVTESMKVAVLAYRPRLDKQEGFWICDVTIDHGPAYFPFVQLGLVRYQPQAVEGLELSPPVAHVAQIPPRREGKVTFSNDRELVLEVHGVGFHRSEVGEAHQADRHLTDLPLLNVSLLRADEKDDVPGNMKQRHRWQRVLDDFGNPVQQLRLRPIRKGGEIWWVCRVTLPRSRRSVDYGLLIEEIELMAADRQTELATPSNCSDLQFHTELEERGPLFSHIVDLSV